MRQHNTKRGTTLTKFTALIIYFRSTLGIPTTRFRNHNSVLDKTYAAFTHHAREETSLSEDL